ncbi:MAG TPA: hypothetical protein VK203_04795 [Nostocaceae cyanobacterium]|nr:hypothetical protein [Nostocaceae cyanobacterium]
MLDNLAFPQATMMNLQHKLEVLENCLNEANPEDEAMAEIYELTNIRQISLIQLKEEFATILEKLNKFNKLNQILNQDVKQEDSEFLRVRRNFVFKEIIDDYSYLFLKQYSQEMFKQMTKDFAYHYNNIKEIQLLETSGKKDSLYISLECLKHLLQSLIKASLRVQALTQEEINALELGDITPKESEIMLTFLASRNKWDQVYRNLA